MLDFIEHWSDINYFIYIGLLLFIGKILKEKLPFLNKVIIPTALLAGVIGLLLSEGFILENGIIPIGREADGSTPAIFKIVYHSIAIGFIALSLKRTSNKTNKKVWSSGMIIVLTYLLQALIGLSIVFFLFTQIFPGAGMLLPLGFGQGPGLATTIGNNYSINGDLQAALPIMGFDLFGSGAALGATIASIGFIIGGTIGVVALNYYARKLKLNVDKYHDEKPTIKETFEFETIKEVRLFDALTSQIVIIFVIYAAVFGTLVLLENVVFVGEGLGATFAGVFHGFNFLLGIVYALLFKKVLSWFEARGKNVNFVTNNYILSNISSVAFNFMITAAVLTITISAIKAYALLVLVMAVIGGAATFFFLKWIIKRVYGEEFFVHYFLGFFGMLTGTVSTGMALLKGVDPKLETPVAEEMVIGSGTAISMALPLFAVLMLPTLAVVNDNGFNNALAFIILGGYFVVLLGILLFINRKK